MNSISHAMREWRRQCELVHRQKEAALPWVRGGHDGEILHGPPAALSPPLLGAESATYLFYLLSVVPQSASCRLHFNLCNP